MYYHKVLTVLFIGTLVEHVVDVGGIQVHKLLFTPVSTSNSAVQIDSGLLSNINSQQEGRVLKDGMYTGEASGFRPGLKVSVEIKDNKIINIEVTEHNEVSSRFYSRPIQTIPQEIINAQSTDVDTVSGATYTSVGIINAVNNALSQALVSGELPENKELPQNSGKGGHFPSDSEFQRNSQGKRHF